MTARACPVCNTDSAAARLFLEQNIDQGRLSGLSFASRKTPEFMCHRLVQCETCGLVYADDPPDQSILAQAYHAADFDSADEADDAARAYDRAVQPIIAGLKHKSAALEIGTGTGVFLEALVNSGFEKVIGIEPSPAAIAAAPPHRRAWIQQAIFDASNYAPASFDFICCFMTLEHVRDPQELVSGATRLLKPGGAIVLVTHDYLGLVNRILGKRSPIIDVEHMQLFSRESIEALLKRNSYRNITVSGFSNRYRLRYWIRLLPLPSKPKAILLHALERTGMSDKRLTFNVGNILSYGYRPES